MGLFSTLGLAVKPFLSKTMIIQYAVIGILIFSNYKTVKMLQQSNHENRIANNNMTALANNFNEKFETLKLDNGKLLNRIDALTIDAGNLQQLNSGLNQRIHDLNLKINNLESVTDIGIGTNITLDSIKTILDKSLNVHGKHKTYSFHRKDDYLDLSAKLNVYDSIAPVITEFNLQTKDSLLIAPEIKYKKLWWTLWLAKRPTGMKLNVNSASPYSKINYIQHYNFKDLRK